MPYRRGSSHRHSVQQAASIQAFHNLLFLYQYLQLSHSFGGKLGKEECEEMCMLVTLLIGMALSSSLDHTQRQIKSCSQRLWMWCRGNSPSCQVTTGKAASAWCGHLGAQSSLVMYHIGSPCSSPRRGVRMSTGFWLLSEASQNLWTAVSRWKASLLHPSDSWNERLLRANANMNLVGCCTQHYVKTCKLESLILLWILFFPNQEWMVWIEVPYGLQKQSQFNWLNDEL